MRVYELAWKIRVEASVALSLVQAEGEYVTSHLSEVALPVVKRILADPPEPTLPERESDDCLGEVDWEAVRLRNPALMPGYPRAGRRRKRGPARLTRRLPPSAYEECWHRSQPCECRYPDEVTTRDAAEIFRVKPATVRQWVHKGYLKPSGRLGVSNTFLLADLERVTRELGKRGKTPGTPAAHQRYGFVRTNRLPHHQDERLLTIPDSATLLGLSPSTIRSWIHRGILTPAPSSRPRATRIRQGDLVEAAQRSGSSLRHRRT